MRRWRRRPRRALSCRRASRWRFRAVRSSRRPSAWELQEATGGKFRLGLGTQVRTHVVRRYGVDFERPGSAAARLRAGGEGVLQRRSGRESWTTTATSTTWTSSRRSGARARSTRRIPKVDIAAVNPWMLRMAGEVADGVHVHPLGEPGYIARHVVPNVAEGAEKSGRSTVGHRGDRAGDDDRRRQRRGTAPRA